MIICGDAPPPASRSTIFRILDIASRGQHFTAGGHRHHEHWRAIVLGRSPHRDVLDVTLPESQLDEVLECTEDAADCALDASSISEVNECAADLQDCAADVIESVDVPEELTCEQQWTACMARNPFGFFKCAADLASCE